MKSAAPPIAVGMVASIFFCCAASPQTVRTYTTQKQRADAVMLRNDDPIQRVCWMPCLP
jgi:hypothetical protein